MEELTSSLSSSFTVQADHDQLSSATSQHPRFSDYKAKPSKAKQGQRRLEFLEYQRKKREDLKDHARRLAEDDWDASEVVDVDDEDDDEENKNKDEEQMEVAPSYVQRSYKPKPYYKDQLMLSEWLVDVPHDLEQNWLMVPCPVGKRCLVVASKCRTTSYSRSGFRINTFTSVLPGGGCSHRGYTILDCIYSDVQRCYYILDCMSWNDHPIYDTETDFRFQWLRCKVSELPNDISIPTSSNPYKFVVVPLYSCELDTITGAMEDSLSFSYQVDGLLFYHKESHYTFGATPLVGWLKPYMLPEVLAVPVPEAVWEQRPGHYTTARQDIDTYNRSREELMKIAEAKRERKVENREERRREERRGEKREERRGEKREEGMDTSGLVESKENEEDLAVT